MQKSVEYIGDLKVEFQEIDRLYEYEKVVEDIFTITAGCMSG